MKNKLRKALMANDSFPGLFEQQSSIQFQNMDESINSAATSIP